MPWLKRKPNRMDRLLAASRLQEAMGRAEDAADQCVRVCTVQGRKAHLRLTASSPGVLCGWPGPWVPAPAADPPLPLCKLCEVAAEAAGKGAAS